LSSPKHFLRAVAAQAIGDTIEGRAQIDDGAAVVLPRRRGVLLEDRLVEPLEGINRLPGVFGSDSIGERVFLEE
jgi:hypothetical protein